MEKRKRHWFLLIVLVFLAISIIFSTIDILVYSSNYKALNVKVTDFIILLHTFSAVFELYLLYLIFKWKKIGFNGLFFLYLFVNLYILDKTGNMNIASIAGGFTRLGTLYIALLFKANNKSGWQNLE
jgi:hypothetical protein